VPKSKAKSSIKVRRATQADVPALVKLNIAAYPVLANENVVWGEAHLRSHLRLFPQGQLVAVHKGRIVGAASSLVVDLGPDPLRNHTWSGVTDSGYFESHNPRGDTLYGADVYVDPKTRGMGVGAALYAARRKLCQKLNLRRILAGGRLVGYKDHAADMTPQEYAERVAAGEIHDFVLSFQLREGFQLRGVMPHYLLDPSSHNHASLIEWINPDYRPRAVGSRKVRVACVQYQMRQVRSFEEFARQVTYFTDVAADSSADFVLFPELFTVQLLSITRTKSPLEGIKRLAKYAPKVVKLLRELAVKYDVTIIGGSHPTKVGKELQNICSICLPDGSVHEQPKLQITPNERKWWGISGGHTLQVIDTPVAKIGVLICYDSEFPELSRYLADHGVEIVFVPFCTNDRQGYLRVRYCSQARCIEQQVYVAIAGNVGNLPDVENMDVNYAQAAVLTPSDYPFARDGIAAEADSSEETVLICDLDLDDLHDARDFGTVTPRRDRREDLFKLVAHVASPPPPPADKVGPLGTQREWRYDNP